MVQQAMMDKMSVLTSKPTKTVKSKDSGTFANMLLKTAKSSVEGMGDAAEPKNGETSDVAMCEMLGVSGGAFDFVMMQDALQMMNQNQTVQNGIQSELIIQMPMNITQLVADTQITESPPDGMCVTPPDALLSNKESKSTTIPLQEMQRLDMQHVEGLPQKTLPIAIKDIGNHHINNSVTMDNGAVLEKTPTTSLTLDEKTAIIPSRVDEKVVTLPFEIVGKETITAPDSTEKSILTSSRLVDNSVSLSNTTTSKNLQSMEAVVFDNPDKLIEGQNIKVPSASKESEIQNVLSTHEAINKETITTKPMQVNDDLMQKFSYHAVNYAETEKNDNIYEYAGIATQKKPDDGMIVEPKNVLKSHNLLHTSKNELPIVEQISQKILAHRVQEKEFVMQLFPKELGQVTVKMAIQNSTLVVELCAANPKAQSLILSNADDIRNILQAQCQRDTQVFVPSAQKDYTQQFENKNQNQQNPHEQPQQKQKNEGDEQEIMFTQGFLSALKALENREVL